MTKCEVIRIIKTMQFKMNLMLGLAGTLFALSSCGSGLKRLQNIDHNESGFAIYRSGQPEASDAEEVCGLGESRIFALNGKGADYAGALATKCPKTKVVYDQPQEPHIPVSPDFLTMFDQQVTDAKANNLTILFHCNCGCHRTGRLAAYYRMKYQGWTPQDAIKEMHEVGDDMDAHPYLDGQVYAIYDFIKGRSCTQSADKCVGSPGP
ncbi:MAG: hypothetical protein EOP04_14615 [Proteobacteria bacterium]|nr:MAG: hypothetical protein EOP04_14615 [Pseudomonadota bacterium]